MRDVQVDEMQEGLKVGARWRVATGHQATTDAAIAVLEAGGNAVDAVVAAAATACCAEPLLASLGGGILAIVRQPGSGNSPVALDAFCQTPGQRSRQTLDFYPIIGHFGTDTQEFHIGLASMATPGAIAGLSALSERFGRIPLSEALLPAVDFARRGVALNRMQRYTLEILQPIVRANPDCARLFGLASPSAELPTLGTTLTNPDFAAFLEEWGRQGPDCFYLGEPAQAVAAAAQRRGGHLRREDFADYRAIWRRPLRWTYRDATLWSTPPPAFGGLMLAMALGRLQQISQPGVDEASTALEALIEALDWTDRTRHRLETPEALSSVERLESAFAELCARHALVQVGTTHISIEDQEGLGVALTLSNGEGSGTVVPGTGIMMNNMLGEEDINRCGFHCWPENRRLASMMAPTLIERGRHHWLLGSGGSNRIRSALTQVIVQLIDHRRSLAEAIRAPRFHIEAGQISVEVPTDDPPTTPSGIDRRWWETHHASARIWPDRNLYFGGVHAISTTEAVADHRREGAARYG
jgi:gamma-glutamyltranspeptidase/glutathione hydrolase